LYIVRELQNYRVMLATRDAIGDAFELFIARRCVALRVSFSHAAMS
jgi:hypothetical protein